MARTVIVLGCLFQLAAAALGQTAPETGWIADGTPWKTAYYVRDSGVPGPVLLVVGGIHGNEPAGYRAAEQIRHWPIVRGRMVVIPRANVLALRAGTRFLPDPARPQHDLNRDFPGEDGERPKSPLARAIWNFVRQQRPDWIVDLHEGYQFHISHKPPAGKKKSVGSTVIYRSDPELDPIASRILARSIAR